MSAVAALAVASPFAVVAASHLSAGTPAPEHHEFVRAAVVTDLPNELLSALSQGLSQFGINLPPMPVGLSPSGTQPISAGTLPSPLATAGLTTGGVPVPPVTATGTDLTGNDLANPTLTPALPSPLGSTGDPRVPPTALNPALTEQPINTTGLDPTGLPTYPLMGGDLSGLGGMQAAAPDGGIISDITSAAQQLGVGQAIDLLKNVMVPSITGAIKSAATLPPVPVDVPPAT